MTDVTQAPVIEDWAGDRGRSWAADLDRFESMLAPPGEALVAQAGFRPGERVIDIGCGGGATTLAIAQAVGPEGEVFGFDISAELVAGAERRAAAEGAGNVRFGCGDAGRRLPPGAPYDRLFSRFGSMFFDDAVAGFANLRRMVKLGGRIDLAVWAPARDNPWMSEVTAVARRHVDLPPPVARAPGPFAFDDSGYLLEVLEAAGFRDPEVGNWTGEQPVGGAGATPEEAASFAVRAMAFSSLLAARGSEAVAAAERDFVALFVQSHVPGEGVMMQAKAWLVRAHA